MRLNKTNIKTFEKGREKYFSTIINLTAPKGRKSTNALLGMLTSKLSGNYPLLPEKPEIIDYRDTVVKVKWTRPQCDDIEKDLKDSFNELEKLKRNGLISDWEQLPS